MKESQLQEKIKQAEEVYEGLVQTRRSLGTMFAHTVYSGRDLDEFGRQLRDLPLLISQADRKRIELRHELLDQRARWAEDDYRRAAEEASKAARALEQARRAYKKAEETARRSGLEARRLAELRDNEAKHLQELLGRESEESERYQGKRQRAEQGDPREEVRGGSQGTQERRQGEEKAHDLSRAYGDMPDTSGTGVVLEDADHKGGERPRTTA